MTVRDDAWTQLTAGTTALTALISTRVYRDLVPQNPTYPCIAYRKLSRTGIDNLDAPGSLARTTIEVACFASDAGTAETVAEAVRANMNGWRSSTGTVDVQDSRLLSELDLYDEGTQTHQVSLDFEVWHTE